jgi:hypothetical protein
MDCGRSTLLQQFFAKLTFSYFEGFAMGRRAYVLTSAFVAIVFAGAAVFLFYRDEMNRGRAMASTGGQISDTTVGPVEYAEKGTGRPLLSIHGAGGGDATSRENIGELSKNMTTEQLWQPNQLKQEWLASH